MEKSAEFILFKKITFKPVKKSYERVQKKWKLINVVIAEFLTSDCTMTSY